MIDYNKFVNILNKHLRKTKSDLLKKLPEIDFIFPRFYSTTSHKAVKLQNHNKILQHLLQSLNKIWECYGRINLRVSERLGLYGSS